jgi:NAD-dependent SIR2 family protein deacetylase
MTETVTCEWCGTVVPLEKAVDYKPRNHALSLCPECLP